MWPQLPTNTTPSEQDNTVCSDLLTLLTGDYITYLIISTFIPGWCYIFHLSNTADCRLQHIPYTSALSEQDDEISCGLLTVLAVGCGNRLYNATCDFSQPPPHLQKYLMILLLQQQHVDSQKQIHSLNKWQLLHKNYGYKHHLSYMWMTSY